MASPAFAPNGRKAEREPVTVIEVDRPLTQEEAHHMTEKFRATVDDRPLILVPAGVRLYQVPSMHWARTAFLVALCALLIAIAALLVAVTR